MIAILIAVVTYYISMKYAFPLAPSYVHTIMAAFSLAITQMVAVEGRQRENEKNWDTFLSLMVEQDETGAQWALAKIREKGGDDDSD